MRGWEDYIPGQKQKSMENVWQGRKNRKNGEHLETLILNACFELQITGIADIDKTPEPFKVLSGMHRLKNGTMGFEGVFAKKAQPDFKGVMHGGRAVIFEAKYTETGRITQDQVNEAQTECMNRYFALGAEVFVVVSFGLVDFYRVPWDVWTSMKERFGHKYMNAEDIEAFRIGTWRGEIDILKRQEAEDGKTL